MIGVSCALTGFSVAVAAGLLAGNPGVVVLTRGVAALVICRLLGSFLAMLADRVVADVGVVPALRTQAVAAGPTVTGVKEQVSEEVSAQGAGELRRAA